jgi:hypothetical protein
MITNKEFNLAVVELNGEYVLQVDGVDLDKDPVFFAVKWQGSMGTLEFRSRQIIHHPANGPDKAVSIKDFYEKYVKQNPNILE